MELKDFGNASFGRATPAEVNERLQELAARIESRSGRFGTEPIPTGSLALDRATGCGGLPRGRIVSLVGAVAGSDALALSAVAQVQKHDGVVAILDPGGSLGSQLAEHPEVDLEHLLQLRPATEDEVVEMVLSLVERRAADLVVVTGLHAALGRLSDRASEVGAFGHETLSIAVDRLAAALDSSPVTVLLLPRSGHRATAGSTPARVDEAIDRIVGLQLESKTVARDEGPLLGVNVAARWQSPRSARVSLDPSGAVSRLGDLLETATAGRLIERRGSTTTTPGVPWAGGARRPGVRSRGPRT